MSLEKQEARAETKLDCDDFVRLIDLIDKKKWLQYRPKALHETWGLAISPSQKDLLEHLIKNITFLDENAKAEASQKIASVITEEWNLKAESTFLVAVADDEESDGSHNLLYSLKNKFPEGWSEEKFKASIGKIGYDIKENTIPANTVIVLVDDFIGTGKKIIRKCEWLMRLISEHKSTVEIRFVALAAMSFSEKRLKELGIQYYCHILLQKGISEMLALDKVEGAKNEMREIEENFSPKYKKLRLRDFSLGYNGSEALFSMGWDNVPNNVFPIFWWPMYRLGIPRKTLFKRLR